MPFRLRTTVILAAFVFLCGCAVGYVSEKPLLVSGGLKVKNLLYVPAGKPPDGGYPGILLCHGGMKGVEFATRLWARELARRGYVVVLPQFRGQGGSEGRFEFAEGEVDDAVAALGYLKGLPYVDKGRIGVAGYSLGGLVALRMLERVQDIKAAVIMAAISDPGAFLNKLIIKKFKDNPRQIATHQAEAEERSPMPKLSGISAPMLILHGGRDHTVNPEQSRMLYQSMKELGKDATLAIYPDLTHELMWSDKVRLDATGFLDKQLGVGR